MPYATPLDLLQFGDKEIAERSWPSSTTTRPDGALLRATLTGADRSAWTSEQQAAADQAQDRLESVLDDATAEIDSYKSPHFDPTSATSPLLVRLARDIGRYLLYDDGSLDLTGSPIGQRYKRAVQILEDLRDGKAQLDGTATTTNNDGLPEFVSDDAVFTRTSQSVF